MLNSHPSALSRGDSVSTVLEALALCEQICTACADACMAEYAQGEKLSLCIRLNLNCADVCYATTKVLTRRTTSPRVLVQAQLHACSLACGLCRDECHAHGDRFEHCALCAEACHACKELCTLWLASISPEVMRELGREH